jgi:hypothetical protein
MNVKNTIRKTTDGPLARSIPVFKLTIPEIADVTAATLKLRMDATTTTWVGSSSRNQNTTANVSSIPKMPQKGKGNINAGLTGRVRLTGLATSIAFISSATFEIRPTIAGWTPCPSAAFGFATDLVIVPIAEAGDQSNH